MSSVLVTRRVRRASLFVFVLLAIEFIDEFAYGVREAAWPLIRADFNLTYAQIGVLLGVPAIIATIIEPFFGIIADGKHRRTLILGGGAAFTLALLLIAVSRDFALLLSAFILFYPSSGAFVGVSQAVLMDLAPTRHEQNMARWTFAGSVGIVLGPIALGAFLAFGAGWRDLHLLLALIALGTLAAAFAFRASIAVPSENTSLLTGMRDAFRAMRRGDVMRWLVLLQTSDLMLDVLHGYLALYFVDVVGTDERGAGIAILIWTVVGMFGDLALIPLLDRVQGLRLLRVTAIITLILFPIFLLVPGYAPKLLVLVLLNLSNTGWYPVLAGRLYSALPGKSGTVITVSSLFGIVGGFLPVVVGVIAQQIGLPAAMWLMMLAPVALLVGLPRRALVAELVAEEEASQ